ncbi:MAG: hypothetical protein ACTSQO_14775 [Candidatus Helarchaeota archaeon]
MSKELVKIALKSIYQIEPLLEIERINGIIQEFNLRFEHKLISKLTLNLKILKQSIRSFSYSIKNKN